MYDIVKHIRDEIAKDELKEQEKEKQRERNEKHKHKYKERNLKQINF